jgi:hypothetical protein
MSRKEKIKPSKYIYAFHFFDLNYECLGSVYRTFEGAKKAFVKYDMKGYARIVKYKLVEK